MKRRALGEAAAMMLLNDLPVTATLSSATLLPASQHEIDAPAATAKLSEKFTLPMVSN